MWLQINLWTTSNLLISANNAFVAASCCFLLVLVSLIITIIIVTIITPQVASWLMFYALKQSSISVQILSPTAPSLNCVVFTLKWKGLIVSHICRMAITGGWSEIISKPVLESAAV